MELLNQVTLSLNDYNFLRDEYTEATKENRELNAAIEDLQDNDVQKVIIRECEQWEDENGDKHETRTTSVKGFDDVKHEVEEFFKCKKFDELKKENEEIKKKFEDSQRMYLDALCTISDLKNRNLWQRIINK